MIQISERIQNLNESPIVTFAALASNCPGVVSLNSGSPGHGVIPGVQQAIHRVGAKEISVYRTPHYGSLNARNDAQQYFQQRYGLEFDPNQEINLTTGFTHLFHCLCTTIINPGDTALFIEPFFPQYEQPLALAGGKMVVIPTQAKHRWQPQPEAIKTALNHHPDAKMIVFNYPNNPSGATLSEDDWNAIIDILIEEMTRREPLKLSLPLVLIDEAYVPLFHHGEINEHPTFGLTLHKRLQQAQASELASLHQLMESVLIACTLSKQGTGGTLLGLGASKNVKLLEAMRIPQKATVINSNAMGEVALSAVIQPDPHKTIEWAGSLYESRLNQLALGLNAIFEKCNLTHSGETQLPPASFVSEAGMYLYANFSALKGYQVTADFREKLQVLADGKFNLESLYRQNQINTSLEVALWLLVAAKVSTVPIGKPEDCYLRFSVGLPQSVGETDTKMVDRQKTEAQGKQLISQALAQIELALPQLVC
ncbi:pyridoxal phosphate-dependent aminotransferase [Coleofasciculus sp.]|uniref:pyridoxal phosphate-dependent aminotransferase n=1 Tax=Coleofasciculus sp. TaxID=3100458 RepID=UPI0039F87309